MMSPIKGIAARIVLSVALPPVTKVKFDNTSHRLPSRPRTARAGAIRVVHNRFDAAVAVAHEEDKDSDRCGQHQHHHAYRGDTCHRAENPDEGIDAEDCQDGDDDCGRDGLYHRRERRRIVVVVDLCQPGGQ